MFLSCAVILLSALSSFVVCPKPDIDMKGLTITTYESWQCEGLCKDMNSESHKKIKEKCLEFREQNGYTEKKIKEDSGCKRSRVKLYNSTTGRNQIRPADIGICYLSQEKSICISRAENQDDALIWSRSKLEMKASQYEFSGPSQALDVCESDRIIQDFWKENEEGGPST